MRAGALDLAEDVEGDHAADVDETNEHHGLGAQLESLGFLAERGQVVALAVGPALLLREGGALVLGLGSSFCGLSGLFFRGLFGVHVYCDSCFAYYVK